MPRRAIFALCCALCLLLPFASLAETTFAMAGFDGDESQHDWSTNAFFTRMQARTGLTFTFDQYTDYTRWQQAKQQMFAEGPLPDVLFKAALTAREQAEYAAQGKLIDLKPLLPQYAPNLWALLSSYPDWLAAATLPDGKIVALPSLSDLAPQNAMWINRAWLDRLNLAMPTDLDSLLTVLRAFQSGDPNQNGKADEIPFSFLGPWDLKFLAHAEGLIANDYGIYLDDTGTVRYMAEQDGFIRLLQWLRAAWEEGLLDESSFTTSDSLRTVQDKETAAPYGLFFGPNPMNLLPYETALEYELLPPLAYEGKQVYRDLSGGFAGGAFAITSACADPGALLGWVDTLYTAEGAVEAMAGKAGEDYTLAADGSWTFAGDLQTQSSYLLYDLSVYDTGTMPWLFPTDFYVRYQNEGVSKVSGELLSLNAYLKSPFPAYTLTSAQLSEVQTLQDTLGYWADTAIGSIVLGETPIATQADIDAYRAALREHGSAQMVAFWQQVADSLTP